MTIEVCTLLPYTEFNGSSMQVSGAGDLLETASVEVSFPPPLESVRFVSEYVPLYISGKASLLECNYNNPQIVNSHSFDLP